MAVSGELALVKYSPLATLSPGRIAVLGVPDAFCRYIQLSLEMITDTGAAPVMTVDLPCAMTMAAEMLLVRVPLART